MDHPEFVTHEDRRIMIGILAHLGATFRGGHERGDARDSLSERMLARFRRDLGRDLGHSPTDEECVQQLDDQIERLRYSIGEFD